MQVAFTCCELFFALDLGAVGAEEVEAAGIDDGIDVGVGDFEQVAFAAAPWGRA